MNLLGIYGLFWWSKHIGKFPCSLRMSWVLRTACSLISIFFLYWYNFHCFFIKMSICFFFFFLVINEWFLIMSKLKGLSKSQILSFICKQPFWKFYWCAICYFTPPPSVQHQSVIVLLVMQVSLQIPSLACHLNSVNANLVVLLNLVNVKVSKFLFRICFLCIKLMLIYNPKFISLYMTGKVNVDLCPFQVILDISSYQYQYIILAILVSWSICWAYCAWNAWKWRVPR